MNQYVSKKVLQSYDRHYIALTLNLVDVRRRKEILLMEEIIQNLVLFLSVKYWKILDTLSTNCDFLKLFSSQPSEWQLVAEQK